MKTMLMIEVAAIAFGLGLAAQASADPVTIAFDSTRAVVAGSGCAKGTYTMQAEQNGLQVVFYDYAARVGDDTGKSAARETCTVRIPAVIPHGYYVRGVYAYLGADIEKTEEAGVELALRASIGTSGVTASRVFEKGTAIPPRTVNIARELAFDEASRVRMCAANAGPTILGANIVASATADSGQYANLDIGASMEGLLNLDFVLAPCSDY